jgi:hypothetical protein
VLWLRGDPKGIRTDREMNELMAAQGINLIIPRRTAQLPDGDIAVLPPENSPEYQYYLGILQNQGAPLISERDPLLGLAKAIVYPRRAFRSVIVGIDPGRKCGVTFLGDGKLMHASKIECSHIGSIIKEILGRLPWQLSEIFVGDGAGLVIAQLSMAKEGLSYNVIQEAGSTVNHVIFGYDLPVGKKQSLFHFLQ